MARLPRLYAPGVAQHIIQRGNNKQPCFFHTADYQFYLHHLRESAIRYGVDLHAYVLMTNHIHLMITPQEDGSATGMMQSLGTRFVQYINGRYGRTGSLWEGRYKSTLVDTDAYGLALYRYIECNPLRAGIVDSPGLYLWSSYRANAMGHPAPWLTPHPSYLALGDTLERRLANYRALFRSDLAPTELKRIRDSSMKGWVLGDQAFVARIQGDASRRLVSKGHGGLRLRQ